MVGVFLKLQRFLFSKDSPWMSGFVFLPWVFGLLVMVIFRFSVLERLFISFICKKKNNKVLTRFCSVFYTSLNR